MTSMQVNIISLFLFISILVWLLPLFFLILRNINNYNSKNNNSTSLESKLMICSLSFVGAIWCLRFATSYYGEIALSSSGLSIAEMAFDSLLQALQTMTMNQDCREFIIIGKSMIEEIYSGKYVNFLKSFYGIYVSILNLLAPATSAAALFSILTAVFPKLKLRCSCLNKQYYFSELNERSVALAKSIMNNKTKFWDHPIFVFTDVYVDDENERSSELYLVAKKLGAICVKDDIAHLKIKTFKEKEIFLMDENESDNIKHLSELNSKDVVHTLLHTFIYVFYQDDSYALIEKKIKTDIAARLKGDVNAPVITRVKEYENLILNLLAEKPLIEPLLRNYQDGLPYPVGDKTEEYNLTIIGSGKIGLQMLLSSSWCGQFYGYKLNINVVSNESKEDFESRINNNYPEFIESTNAASSLLKVYNNCEVKNEPYFNLRYGEYDFNKVSLSDVNCVSFADDDGEKFKIIDSDYFLIAIGSDEENMLAAERLKKQISIIAYQQSRENCKNKTIAFAVYNQKFNEILKENSFDNEYKIELYPFGGIEKTYSYQNITMANRDPAAILVGNTYVNQTFKEKTIDEKKDFQNYQNKKIYDIMSSKAREVHFKYRIFSSFLLIRNDENSNVNGDCAWKKLYDFDEREIEQYSYFILTEEAVEKRNNILQYLTWLEHRRWNAYMRSIGFSYDIKKDKDIVLKLHRCLCECSKKPITGTSDIRLNDLKERLFEYALTSNPISKEGFAVCIKEWVRLPKIREQVQIELLLEKLDDDLIQSITELKKSENVEQTLKERLNTIVEMCLRRDNEESPNPVMHDMLDLASEKSGCDKKYFDFPQETDSKLIESYREILKEIH